MGLTIKEATEQTKAFKFLFTGNCRATFLDKIEGFMRLVTTADDNVFIDTQIAGVGTSDMVSEL